MKKTYINPSTEIVKITGNTLMQSTSRVSVGSTPTDPSKSDSRHSTLWDDDEED